jgi:N-acetylmuramoyl-L-alanine amidase
MAFRGAHTKLAGSCLALLCAVATLCAQTNALRIEFTGEPQRATAIGAFRRGDVLYVSLNDLAHVFNVGTYENREAGKLELKRGSMRVKVTASNPYVVLGDPAASQIVHQLPLGVLYAARSFFVPLSPFLRLFPPAFGVNAFYSPDANILQVGGEPSPSLYDVSGVSLEPKSNGILIRVSARKKLRDYENWLRTDGWLYVTIADARADTAAINALAVISPVREIIAIQSPTSVQLTFRLAGKLATSEIVEADSSNDLLILVRSAGKGEIAAAQDAAAKRDAVSKQDDAPRQEAPRTPVAAPKPRIPSRTEAVGPQREVPADLEGRRKRWDLDVIVLDAGHGGHDPGSIGVTGVREKQVTLGVTLKLGALIRKNLPGVEVVYTRKDDRFVELDRRGTIANEAGGKLFISIHANSLRRKPSPTRGFEVYLLRPGRTEEAIAIAERENAVIELEEGYEDRYQQLTEENFILVAMAQSAHVKASELFADLTQRELETKVKIPNRGVKQAGFYVLVGAAMPNVLIETAYLSNREDEKLLKSEVGQQKIAEAIFRAVKKYKGEYEKLLLEGKEIGSTR